MKFENQFREHKHFYSNVGSPIKPIYGLEVDKFGVTQLVEKGQENLYDYIQSHADSVDIHKILERFQNGDSDALNKYQGYYGDITEMPTTFADVLNTVTKAEDLFNSLPVETREKFDFSCGKFIAALGSEAFYDAVGLGSSSVRSDSVSDSGTSEVPETKD